jgi:hypothetical protein
MGFIFRGTLTGVTIGYYPKPRAQAMKQAIAEESAKHAEALAANLAAERQQVRVAGTKVVCARPEGSIDCTRAAGTKAVCIRPEGSIDRTRAAGWDQGCLCPPRREHRSHTCCRRWMLCLPSRGPARGAALQQALAARLRGPWAAQGAAQLAEQQEKFQALCPGPPGAVKRP